jgi:hypothetical protein
MQIVFQSITKTILSGVEARFITTYSIAENAVGATAQTANRITRSKRLCCKKFH